MGFDIGDRHIGDGCYIIAEVGLAHDGSLGMAHSYIDACSQAGVDAVKFQCHLGDKTDEWRIPQPWSVDASRQDYWQRTSFKPHEWYQLKEHCEDRAVEFLCSPFSVEAAMLVNPLVRAWKVPSGKIADMALREALESTGKPVIASTGMATRREIHNTPVGWKLLLCTSHYPTNPEYIGLDDLPEYDGLSDHSGTIYAGLAAVAIGCDILEVHVCFSKQQWGFDTSSSITIEQLTDLVRGVSFIERAKKPVDKDKLADEMQSMRRMFMGVA